MVFDYEALTADGKKFHGTMKAYRPEDVEEALLGRGMRALKVRSPRPAWLRAITPQPRKVKAQEVILFCRQLAMFVHVGIPVTTALQTIGEQASSERLRSACIAMIGDIGRGGRLSDAMRAHPLVFPALLADMVRAAEVTGNLDGVLRQASHHIEREAAARQKIRAAMIYPSIIFTVAVLIITGIIVFVLPQFRTLYDSLGVKLPGIVSGLLAFTDFVGRNAIWIVALLLVGLVAALWWIRTPGGRYARDRFFLRLPLIAPMLQAAVTERFCRTFSDMLSSGVPMSQTFTATIDSVGNRVYAAALRRVMGGMTAGEGVYRPLHDTKLFSPVVLQMVRVGEETGSLDAHLAEAAEMNGQELDYRIKRMTSVIEPAMIVLVGTLVGFIAATMISAIYSLAGNYQ